MKKILILIIILICLIFTSCIKESDVAMISEEDNSVSSSDDAQQTDKQPVEKKITIDTLKESGYEILDNQIIDIEYNDLPDTKLISAVYLKDDKRQLKFFLANGDEVIYTLPEFSGNKDNSILELKKINNVDVNNDDKKDIVFYASVSRKDDLGNTVDENICGNYLLEDNIFIEGEPLWQELIIDSIEVVDKTDEDDRFKVYIENTGKYILKIKIPARLEKDKEFDTYVYNGDQKTKGCTLFGYNNFIKANWENNIMKNIKNFKNVGMYGLSDDINKYQFDKTKYNYDYAIKSKTVTAPEQQVTLLIKLNSEFLYNLELYIDEYDLQIYDMKYMLDSIQLIEN